MENSQQEARPNTSTSMWKQWFFLYPTFAIAVLGAIPQYIDVVKGFMIDVKASQVAFAESQNSLWVRNLDCKITLNTVKTQKNTQVSVGACPSGDIQVNIEFPDNTKVVRWVGFDELKKSNSISTVLLEGIGISTAMAAEPVPGVMLVAAQEVLCQRVIGTGSVVRIIKNGNQCHKQVLNTYTGAVVSQTEVACNTSC